MSKTSKAFMRKIRRKLNRVIELHSTACGFGELVQQANQAQKELERELEECFERVERGGVL